jgi:class 3 adenylate cyclase
MAARVCSAALPGQILATGATVAAANGAIRAESIGKRALKGFSAEVELFAVSDAS